MKINRTEGAGFFTQNPRVNRSNATAQAQNTRTVDELSLSQNALSFSKVLSEARRTTSVQSPERQEHIARLRDSIADGSYKVGSDAVAESILKSIYG